MVAFVGPELIVQTMSTLRRYGNDADRSQFEWQYHSRSDFHSRIAALAVTVDLLRESSELQALARSGAIGFQVNPKLTDRAGRVKTLDLMIGRLDDQADWSSEGSLTLVALMEREGIAMSPESWETVHALPNLPVAPLKSAMVVLENKACMTAFRKAAPRLRNELEGAVDAINHTNPDAVAAALVLVNASASFYSPTMRQNAYVSPVERALSKHVQPAETIAAIEKLMEIPLRRSTSGNGYDDLGLLVVEAENSGTPWAAVDDPARGAPPREDIHHYVSMIQHMAALVRSRGL